MAPVPPNGTASLAFEAHPSPVAPTATGASVEPALLDPLLLTNVSLPVAASFKGCGSFPHPWEAGRAPKIHWPPQVPVFPGRACIGYPNWYMMECCAGRRDYICGWEVCMGSMSDDQIESCFRRLANRDGRRGWDDEDDDMHPEHVNVTERGRYKWSYSCASGGERSAAPSSSGRSSGQVAVRVTILAVTAAIATSVLVVV
jgi:hypothetical protein